MTASKKTTTAGIAALLAAVVAILNGVAQGDLASVDWASIVPAIIASIGLLFARDNNVTSERAGAK